MPRPSSRRPIEGVGNPDDDNRMLRVARGIPHHDVRMLIRQGGDFVASHERAAQGLGRISLQELLDAYEIDEALAAPPPTAFAILDDVLTNGTRYLAMITKLAERFPGVPIIGLFITRRVFPREIPPREGCVQPCI